MMKKNLRIKGYPFDPPQAREELRLRTFEYDMPFNYSNITVYRKEYDGGEFHGIELFTRNEEALKVELTRVVPGEWTRMQAVYEPPPEAVRAEFRVEVADMTPDEILCIADACAGEVPDGWNPYDDLPAGLVNLIANPTFAGSGPCPRGWTLDTGLGENRITPLKRDAAGHAGLRIERAQIALCTEVPVRPGRRIVYALWAKSTNKLPKTVWLFPRWKNQVGGYVSDSAGDRIIVAEEQPIVRVAVLGSACTPPGYVMLEAEPVEEFYRRGDFVRCTAPLRFRQGGLWGMHLRADQWGTGIKADFGYEAIPAGMIRRYPGTQSLSVKTRAQEFPFTGMSCAVFEIPGSRRVTIYAGSESPGWLSDNFPNDDHYSVRTIRTTVAVRAPGRRGGR